MQEKTNIMDVVGIIKTDKPLVDIREVRDSIYTELAKEWMVTNDVSR